MTLDGPYRAEAESSFFDVEASTEALLSSLASFIRFDIASTCFAINGARQVSRKEVARLTSRPSPEELEALVEQLFRLQDLDADGFLSEDELVKLNEKIGMLHFGKEVDRLSIRQKYQQLFRTHLDSHGQPVTYDKFRQYMFEALHQMDQDTRAQEMILEQYLAEAQSGRALFHCPSFSSVSDERFMAMISSNGDVADKHCTSF